MLKALIFDMDGTLVHSDPVHMKAFIEVLSPEGVTIDDEVYRSTIIGRTNETIFASLLPHRSVDEHVAFADEKEAAFRRLALDLNPLDGLIDLLDWAEAQGIKIALVTNAPRLNAEHMLDVLGITERFPVQITIDQVARGKPDPLPYLTALERLGVRAEEAIAFEDSPSGMKAAKGAGIYSFGVLTGLKAEEMLAVGADATLADFRDSGLWNLLKQKSAA
ncbi:HAD family hydrolase [Microvirga guangxiensis]|uniref:Haloacid dehalogenase superfamily, subfamily IA, variant 3 with third motif having DD or ED n=1 Tax=Microvirga guangxiensis TaxID=549386 RepID=A0A1G5KW34_9HYPH|nr:HAD family phosphatase [Microvirga guangxiensis]SCZ04825.1 haloacid dehalogenase superfamily, subfamily IA, variant 3 with third motif having DD or ED [Microvirga guangxiensis]